MKPEYAQALIALIDAQSAAFLEACASAEDPQAFATEILDYLAEAGGQEVADDTEDPADAA